MTVPTTEPESTAEPGRHRTVTARLREEAFGRRRFLTYLVAGSTLTVAAKFGLDSAAGDEAAALPLPSVQPADLQDLGDILILAGAPTEGLLFTVEVQEDGRVRVELPRAEVGQGITTATAMIVAEELGTSVSSVDVALAPARPELLFNQLTGGSNTMRSIYRALRAAAAAARTRLVQAGAQEFGVPVEEVSILDGNVVAGTLSATIGALSRTAAQLPVVEDLVALPKLPSSFEIIGKPHNRIDARKMVTGEFVYTLDLDIPGAVPTMVCRPRTWNAPVESIDNEAEVRALPGIIDLAIVETGVAVLAETFGQALAGKQALKVTWGAGTVDGISTESIKQTLRSTAIPMVPPISLPGQLEFEFDCSPVSHAPLETNCAIADVRDGSAEIWGGMKSPIVSQQDIANALGLPQDAVTCHVMQGGGSFGRKLFWDGPLEAARISQKTGKVIKLMWSRIDDMRHGRARPTGYHKYRVTTALGSVARMEHHCAYVETDWGHGLGEILTATVANLPVAGNLSFSQTVFLFTVKSPYDFGVSTQLLNEAPLKMPTAAWRSVYSVSARGTEEIVVDQIAKHMGKDPVEFRKQFLKNERATHVLEKVAEMGDWGRSMPAGHAQGIAVHGEYRSFTACMVEIDATDPANPRVTKARVATDAGLPINPRGLAAQAISGLTDGISLALTAGLHIEDALPLEGSYSQYHYARQADSPTDVEVHIVPGNGEVGGAGELGVPAAFGAVANAYAAATGTVPTRFPINFPVDFEPFERQ